MLVISVADTIGITFFVHVAVSESYFFVCCNNNWIKIVENLFCLRCKCYDRLWPQYASALNNLAVLLVDAAEAESLYRQAVHIQPCHANAHFSLGNLLRYQYNMLCLHSFQCSVGDVQGYAVVISKTATVIKSLSSHHHRHHIYLLRT